MKEQLLVVWEVFQESLRVGDYLYDTIQFCDFETLNLRLRDVIRALRQNLNSNERPNNPCCAGYPLQSPSFEK